MKEIRSISLIGYGLVGRAMATYFQSKGLEIHQILVRKKPSQNHMESAPFNFITQLELLEPCDLLLVCVNDDALIDLIPQLPKSQWIAYTSGAVGLDVFENAPHVSVFYPLQSFAFLRREAMAQIPILIETQSAEQLEVLKNFALAYFDTCQEMDSASRAKLHLAAVFANNFTNNMMTLAADYCQVNQIDFALLKPLVLETAHKWMQKDANELQTGPAIRGDETVLQKQMGSLDGFMLEIYQTMTKAIQEYYKNK